MTYNFKSIDPIPTSSALIDIILSKTQRKTPTVVHPGYKITRIRKFYMRKVKFTSSSIHQKFDAIVQNFPKLDDIHPFYSYLMNILYDKDHYKLALGHIKTCTNIIDNIGRDYVRLIKYADSLYRCKMLKKAALGRMATQLKKLKATLSYLEQVRQHLGRIPAIDPNTRTLLLCGYPNVGKSSFMNNITHANVDVQSYEFTTQALFVGHTQYQFARWQVIDTPGVLDHPLDKMSMIEMQAIAALAHINACILFFIDVSENCGYSVKQQIKLFDSIKALMTNKPLVIIANKIDAIKWEEVDKSDRDALQEMAKTNNGFLIKMSNKNGTGIENVKKTACDILLDYRLNQKAKSGKKFTEVLDKIHVGMPSGTSKSKIKPQPQIPQSVRQGLKRKDLGLTQTVKQIQEEHGGAGVFFIPQRAHYTLQNPDWNDDVIPQIMDGKNIADFVDKQIMQKLNKLQAEEQKLEQFDRLQNLLQEDTDEQLVAAIKQVEGKKSLLKQDHQMRKKTLLKRSTIKMRDMQRKFQELGLDADELLNKKAENGEIIGIPKKRDDLEPEKDRARSLLSKRRNLNAKIQQHQSKWNDDDSQNEMDVEGKQQTFSQNKRGKKIIQSQKFTNQLQPKIKLKRKIEQSMDDRLQTEVNPTKAVITQEVKTRIQGKIKRRWNRNMWVNESDRKIATKLPKHLFSGKRPKGHLDRR